MPKPIPYDDDHNEQDERDMRKIYGSPLSEARGVVRAPRAPKSASLAKNIARQSSGNEAHLLQALTDAGAVILRAYPAPSYALAKDERRDLLQIHVRFPDGLIGYYSPGGPPRLWNYVFVAGGSPNDENLPGVLPNQIKNVTTKSYSMREPHVVRDFNTLDDLIRHARDELGATHVEYEHDTQGTRLFFPRKDGQYEVANTWQKAGYWHATGPGSREIVRHLPRGAQPLKERRRAREVRQSPRRSAHHKAR